jgi:hypothetical protein
MDLRIYTTKSLTFMTKKALLSNVLRLAVCVLAISLLGGTVQAQVISSAISGRVADSKGELLIIPCVRVGGPYTVAITDVGFKEQVQDNI